MKFRKILALLVVAFLVVVLVACSDDGKKKEVDPKLPTNISIKVRTAKVQINNQVKLTYTITPATAQDDQVKVTLNNDLCTYAIEGNKTIVLTAGSETGTVKVTVETSNGLKASKTIKVQLEEVQSYPDLSGYNIKLAQAEMALGYYDVKLTRETEDKYNYYSSSDRDFKIQAWDEIEENYNCTLSVDAYPSDAPWGPARWQYILGQAQAEAAEYDFYVTPDGQIPGFVAGNAILDLTDWYADYGKNIMTNMNITAGTYKQRLYSINEFQMNIYNMLGYNVALWEKINKIDPTIVTPAQMYLDDNWNYNTFKEYCKKVQTALDTMSTEEEKYYALSGYGTYYWLALVNAAGVKVLDTTQLKVNLTGTVETLAAQTLQDLYADGCMDPAFSVDGGVTSWNTQHALLTSGDFWFVKNGERWTKTLWGTEEETRYGYVPYPTSPDSDVVYVGTCSEACIVMAAGREWAYEGFGDECNSENIYKAYMDYLTTARAYYTTSESYSKEDEIRATANEKFGDADSVKAYLKVMLGVKQDDGSWVGGIDEYGFYDPYVENSNSVVGNYGGAGTLAGDINTFIKGGEAQWIDTVGTYESIVNKAIVDSYG